LMSLDNGDWVQMNDVQFGTVAGTIKTAQVTASTAAPTVSGVSVDVRVDSATGPLLGNVVIHGTADGNTYAVNSAAINTAGLTGRHNVFFTVRGSGLQMITFFELK
ncbi:MAG TPA: carbohydrate-binding protein, partial [Polyangia bacterium]|nr:carbohydrate-binding protein [Polyangia bacterium]